MISVEVLVDEMQLGKDGFMPENTNSALNIPCSQAEDAATGTQLSETNPGSEEVGANAAFVGLDASDKEADTSRSSGRPSTIAEYCNKVLNQGQERCIFICRRRNNRMFAQDIRRKDEENPVISLQDQDPWWSRWSLYRVVSVRHVKVGNNSDVNLNAGLTSQR